MITFEKSIEIYRIIENTKSDFLKNELVEKAFEYARIRADWFFMDQDSRRDNDKGRRIKHDAFIDSLNSIYRFMKTNNEDSSWYDELPDFRSPAGRKE